MERCGNYRFSLEAKQYARDRANSHCEYDKAKCPNPNTGRVNHITGAFEGFLKGADPRDISDPKQNATMECETHEAVHDAQERLNINQLRGEIVIYERKFDRGYKARTRRSNKRRSTGKRR